jgi:type II secretory pathway pseudopilin PulG
MRFRPTNQPASAAEGSTRTGQRLARRRPRRGGFTLAEVLAALVFMAIVIPVAVQGLRVANLAGQVGERKAVAIRIAERALNELVVTRQWQTASQEGSVQEGPVAYRWTMRLEPWNLGALRLLTVQVTFLVQGQDYDVRLSTLVDPTSQ